jgi:hypothetical protein
MSIRNAAWFSTVAYPMLARYLPAIDLSPLLSLRRYAFINQMLEPSGESQPSSSKSFGRMNGVILVAAVVMLVMQSPWVRPWSSGKSLLADQTPVGAANFIAQHELKGHLFHPQEFGDYLMWRLWPQQKTFVDGRVHLFSLDFLNDYERAIEDPVSSGILDRWNVQYVLLRKVPADVDLKAMKSVEAAGWGKIFEDDVAALYEKKF